MRIVLFTIGTEGDVRPLVALGLGLQREGHDVIVATDPSCADLVSKNGLTFAPLSGDFLEWMKKDDGLQKRALATFAMVDAFRKRLKALAEHWCDQGLSAAKGADLLIGNGMVFLLAEALGQKLGVPVVETQLVPTLPSHNPPIMPLPNWGYNLPGAVNRMLGQMMGKMVWSVYRPAYDEVVRPRLGLAPYLKRGPYNRPQTKRLSLFGYSPTLVEPGRDWPQTVKVTGPWYLEQRRAFQPDDRLRTFLEDGPPPVYAGFGSMYHHDAKASADLIKQAARQANRRLILASGWGGLNEGDTPDKDVLVIERAPHDWLFPKMALAIHHGGVGTTNAACRAGIPSVVVPVFGDQPFWAARLRKLGLAGPALPRETLTADALARAIVATDKPATRLKASVLGKKLSAETGVATAIAALREVGLIPAAHRQAAQA